MIAIPRALKSLLTVLVLTALAIPPCFCGEDKSTVPHKDTSAGEVATEQIQLQTAWRITESDLDQADMLMGLIGHVGQDVEGRVLLLDVQMKTVWIYSADGTLEGSFGQEGEGPGELSGPCQVGQLPDGRYAILESFPGRLILFDSAGLPAGTIAPVALNSPEAPKLSVSRFQVAGNTLVMASSARSIFDDRVVSVNQLASFDMDGKLKSVLAEHREERDPGKKGERTEESMMWLRGRWATAPSGNVYAAFGYRGYEITVFDDTSAGSRKVSRPYESMRRDALAIQDAEIGFRRFARGDPNTTFIASDVHSDIVDLVVRPNNELWIQPSDGKWHLASGVLAEYDVFDESGAYIKRVQLLGKVDPQVDKFFLLSRHLVVVHDFMGRARRMAGVQSTEDSSTRSKDDVVVTCYRL